LNISNYYVHYSPINAFDYSTIFFSRRNTAHASLICLRRWIIFPRSLANDTANLQQQNPTPTSEVHETKKHQVRQWHKRFFPHLRASTMSLVKSHILAHLCVTEINRYQLVIWLFEASKQLEGWCLVSSSQFVPSKHA
jgi:hypothetical protein